MTHLLLATRNAHKTREFSAILGAGFAITDLLATNEVRVVEETGSTFEENATLKAVAASHVFQGLVVADDSGLEVTALGGAPGVRSARYAGENATDRENIAKLLKELTGKQERAARFSCAIVVAQDGKVLHVVHGTVAGTIADEPRGRCGFGYDPVFIPQGFAQTFAEFGGEAKNRLSHRAAAISKLRHELSQEQSRAQRR